MSHICHIATAHKAFDTRIFVRECRSLQQAGYRITLIIPHDKEEVVDGVHIIPIEYPVGFLQRRFLAARKAAVIAQSIDCDAYHFHDPDLLPVMRKVARKTGRPVIWDAHENYYTTIAFYNPFKVPIVSRLAARYFNYMELAACRKDFAGVVTINDIMAKRYRDIGVRTASVGNFPELEAFSYPPSVAKSDVPLFVMAGTIWSANMPHIIAEAFAEVRQKFSCKLAFWGRFDDVDPKELVKIARSKGAPEEDVRAEGPFPRDVLVNELLPTAWAGCVLFDNSDYNNRVGQPNRFFELWANGVSAIVSEKTLVAKQVEEIGGGLVMDNSVSSLANAFERIILEANLADKLGLAGRKAIESKFNWDVNFNELLKLYHDLGLTPEN
ncbi:glycosyltransferase [bacterium]|nr:glycosyltransferase [bacterium]